MMIRISSSRPGYGDLVVRTSKLIDICVSSNTNRINGQSSNAANNGSMDARPDSNYPSQTN